jgi:cob(I)alamin adenosyltransferase
MRKVQKTLLDIGTIVATPTKKFQFDSELVSEIERLIDWMTLLLPPLRNFLLFGSPTGEEMPVHLCRVITRRAERGIVALKMDTVLIQYINRLSDFFYTLARYILLVMGHSEEKNK